MKTWGFIGAVTGLAAAAVVALIIGSSIVPNVGSPGPRPSLPLSVQPLGVTAVSIPAIMCHTLGSDASVGASYVEVQIMSASFKVSVKRILITVSYRQQISSSHYIKCEKEIPQSSVEPPPDEEVQLPRSGSTAVPLLPNMVHGGTFVLKVLPPMPYQSGSIYYRWYLSVFASSGSSLIKRQSAAFGMLAPPG